MSAKINVTVAACAALCRGKVINMAPTGKMCLLAELSGFGSLRLGGQVAA